jgi:hypothetical protein
VKPYKPYTVTRKFHDAERAVLEAAKAMADQMPISGSYHEWLDAQNRLLTAVATLREQEGA